MGNVVPLTVKPGSQSLENGLSCIFQASGSILLQNVQNQHDSAQATEHKGYAEGIDPIWIRLVLSRPLLGLHVHRTAAAILLPV